MAARAGAAAGIAGPTAFTGAWIASSLRQTGYPAAEIQISGLAAPDARDPWIVVAGFVVLGGCTVAFGAALRDALGGHGRAGPAPRLIQGAGLLSIAAGLLRRDRMLLTPGSVSWHNHAHDVISAVIYVDLVAAQVLLAERFGRDPGTCWPGLEAVAAVAAGQRGGHRRAADRVRGRHVRLRRGRAAAGRRHHPAGCHRRHRGAPARRSAQDSGGVRLAVTCGRSRRIPVA